MKFGSLFERWRRSRGEQKGHKDTHLPEYKYRVSTGDNIRFHAEPEVDTHEMRDELRDTFPNLEEVTFTNLRLEHEGEADARAAVAEIAKRNPHFVIVEGLEAPAYAQESFNNYVQGVTNSIGDIRPGEFTGTLLWSLRNLKKEGFPVPLLVLSDVSDDAGLLSKLSIIESMPEILTGNRGTFEDTKKQALSRIVMYCEAVLERENRIVGALAKQIAEATKADNEKFKTLDVGIVERLDILAPYGSSHGTLSHFARARGMRTAAVSQNHSLHPIEGMLNRIKFSVHTKSDLSTKEIDDAVTDGIFAALIESGLPRWMRDYSEYFGKSTTRGYQDALRKVVYKWRTEAQAGTGPSLQELYAEAHKSSHDFFQNRALPLIRSFLRLDHSSATDA